MARAPGRGYPSQHDVPHSCREEGRPLKFGTLQVYPRQGVLKEYGLDLPSAVVGRGEGAQIFIDDFSVSRRHARLTIESGRLLVEDLGSASGTFVDDLKLEPGVRHLVAPDATIRFGEIEARYAGPEAVDVVSRSSVAEPEPTPEEEARFGLALALTSPAIPVDPGKSVNATITVVNRGRQVDTVRLDVFDLPVDWFSFDRADFSLLPGERADIPVALHPPRNAEALAGEYSFTVTATSHEYGESVEADGSFQVQAFEAVSLSLAAVRSRRKFTVVAENKGNEVALYTLEGRDDEQAFTYDFEVPSIELQPGQKATVGLTVAKKPQWFGPAIPLPFEVVGHSASGAEVTARGQLATNPPLERFKLPALYTVAAIALLATLAAVLIITDGSGTKKASAEDPYAGVHLCDDANAKAKQDEKNAKAAQSNPLANATVVGPTDGGRPLFGEVDKNGAPFFAQNDPRWGGQEYARSTQLPNGRDWCGTTIEQCGCAMTSVSVMLALYGLLDMPDGQPLSPKTLNDWFNSDARKTDRGWVSRGYIYGDVIWSAANELSGEIAKVNPNARTVRFVSTGSGSEEEIKSELRAGRPVILEVPGHWIAAVGLDGDTILINDPFYRDRKTLDVYKGKVRSSVHFEPSTDLSAVVITAPADVKFKITDKDGRVVATGTGAELSASNAINQIPGASVSTKKAWRDPTCIEKAPPADAGTNQITLPGSKDDYKVEIIGTGDQPGSVDIHTYAKDGKSTISTIEGSEGTKADLSYDPNAAKPVINIISNGAQASGTPSPAGGSGGGPGDETPTPGPSVLPSPTVTSTPFVEQRTAMTLPAEPGQTRVEVATNSGFELGDPIRFAPGLPNEEDNIIVGFGSFILATPLKFAHSPGEPIQRLQRPPGQGPGLPPGVTPPPATGPIEPPKEITLNCSTLYQASPKQATFICDATVDGAYTTTRWSLNGKVISDFTGASSFIYAFPSDSPASIAVTVCNQTLCRSSTKSERISFPTAGTTTGGGSTARPAGGSTVAPPPPAGQVAVVCGTEFPITPDGQLAQFNCEANFSGDYTNISWSAPGGTPANKNGTSKTFTTTIKNTPGTPPSIKITATVCNFGVCRTSQPSQVGIAQTTVILDSAPTDKVNQGHKLTLMARVQSTGKSAPQGGTVQFYVDGTDKANAIGDSATLFTQGSVAVAIMPVDTTSLSTTPLGGPGSPHNFIGVYSGGTNAFGSDSTPRIITVLPPEPDGCDSINNDANPDAQGNPTDPVTDGTCSIATPRDLGAGTVLNSLSISPGGSGTVTSDGAPNAVIASPGATILVSANAGRTDYCPGCIRQVYLGIGGYDPPPPAAPDAVAPTRIGPFCGLSGNLPPTPSGANFSVPMTVPTEPGVYYIRATTTLDYFCVGPGLGPPEYSVGRIVVEKPITAAIAMWNDGDTWPSLPPKQGDPYDPDPLTLPGRTQISGLSEGDRVVLQATLPPGATGRVEFITDPPNVLLVNGGQPSPRICATTGPNCIAGQARVRTDAIGAITKPFTVTARYVDPVGLELLDPADTTPPLATQTYGIRFAAAPPSNALADVKILTPAKVTVTTSTMPVQMGSDFTLTAEVLSANSGLNLNGAGGTVQFRAGANNIGQPVAVGADGRASITWRAGINPAACAGNPCGGFPFDSKDDGAPSTTYDDIYAIYTTGGASLLENACAPVSPATKPSDPNCPLANVDINPAGSSVTITSVTPANPTAGQSIAILATVTGVPDFPPTNGTVSVAASGGANSSDNGSLGSATVTEVSPGVFQATITFTTGAAGDQMDTPGTYTLTATFLGTSALDTSTSAGFTVPVGKEAASVVLTLPGGATMAAGGAQVAHVVVTASNNAFLDNGNATVDLLDGTTVLKSHNLTNGEAGTFDFSLSDLPVATYSLTARYNGNGYYDAAASSPALSLTVNKNNATISLTNLTRTTDVAPGSTDSVGDQFTIRANVNPGGSPSATGGTVTLKATIDGVTTTLGTHTYTNGDDGRHTFSLDTSTGVLLTTSTIALSIDFDGNAALNAISLPTPVNLTLAKANASVTVSVPSTVTIGDSVTVATSVTAPAGITVECPTATPNCIELRVGGSGGTLIASIAPGASFNALSTGGASGTCLDNASASACTIWVGYTLGSAVLNAASNADSVTINKATPTVSVVATDVTIGGSTGVSVTISGLPSGISPNCTGCVTVTALSTGGGSQVTLATNLDWPAAASQNFVTGSGAVAGSCLTRAGTCRITVSYGGNTNVSGDSDSDSFTINKISSSVALALNPSSGTVTLGNSIQVTATITQAGGAAAPNCSNCLHFRLGSATGTQIGGDRDLTGGTGTFTLTINAGTTTGFTSPGSFTVFAIYDGSSTLDGSQSSVAVTISPAPTSLTATATQGAAAGSAVTLSASITSPYGVTNDIDPGTVQFKVNGVDQGSPVNVNNGAASLVLTGGTLAPGTYQITATYTGGGDYAASSDLSDFAITVT